MPGVGIEWGHTIRLPSVQLLPEVVAMVPMSARTKILVDLTEPHALAMLPSVPRLPEVLRLVSAEIPLSPPTAT